MLPTLALAALLLSPVPVRVVTPDGKPVAGAKVWAYALRETVVEPTTPTPPAAITGADGRAVTFLPPGKSFGKVFARDAAGRVGADYTHHKLLTLGLAEVAPRAGRVTAGGKPVAGAKVRANGYYGERGDGKNASAPNWQLPLPPWEPPAVSDADGRFTLPAPAGSSVHTSVTAEGFATARFVTAAGVELLPKLERPGAVTLTVAGLDAARTKGLAWQLENGGDSEYQFYGVEGETRELRYRAGTLDGSPTQTITGLPPGRYKFSVTTDGKAEVVFVKADAPTVEPGETAAVTATFAPATTVTGKLVGPGGEPGVGADIILDVTDGPDLNQAQRQLRVVSGPDGAFVAHGPPGWYALRVNRPPVGYALRFSEGNTPIPPARVALGTPHAFPPITLLKTIDFNTQVVLEDGTPATGAEVRVAFHLNGRLLSGDADKAGRFAVKNMPPDDALAPRARLGKAVNVPQTYELEHHDGPVTITLSEANGASFTGRVIDQAGAPVAGAKVFLRGMVQGVGRNSRYSEGSGAASTTTDAEGRYTFSALWPGDRYSIAVYAKGFSEGLAPETVGVAGRTHDFGTTRIGRASLSVTGVVRADGKPVAGAEVFALDGPARMTAKSAAGGSFTLTGFFDAPAWVFVIAPGHRLAAAEATPGGGPVAVSLVKQGAPPAPPPVITAEYKAELDKLTRHLLTRLFETQQQSGWSRNAIHSMAKYDLATAKKWRDAAQARPGGKNYTSDIAAAERRELLFTTAKDDIDEAVAILQGLKGDAFDEALALAERLIPIDKAKAARVAEEVAVRARRRGIPEKAYSLAKAGELVGGCGNVAAGAKLLAEAADLAEKLPTDARDRNSMAAGMVACRLALFDWPRAEKMLAGFKDPGDYNRWTTATIERLAATDLERAKSLLDRIKPGSSGGSDARIRLALRIAATRPAEAEALVAALPVPFTRFSGYVRLADATADKPRAVALIGRAFETLDAGADDFNAWSSYGDRGVYAAIGVAHAARVGHPDLANFVDRALSLRPVGTDTFGNRERDRKLVGVATMLALADPPAARRVLAGVGTPEQLVTRERFDSRGALIALALADPAAAMGVVDALLARSELVPADGGDGLSQTGLIELASTLADPDRIAELERWCGGELPLAAGGGGD